MAAEVICGHCAVFRLAFFSVVSRYSRIQLAGHDSFVFFMPFASMSLSHAVLMSILMLVVMSVSEVKGASGEAL